MTRTFSIRCLSLAFIALTQTPVYSVAAGVTEADLERLRERISEVTSRLKQVKTEHNEALQALRTHEVRTSALVKDLHDLQEQLTGAAFESDELRLQIDEERRTLSKHRAMLVSNIRLSYSLGRQDAVKLLLNLEDANSVNRGLSYHVYVQTKRMSQIEAVKTSLYRLETLESAAREGREALERLLARKSAAVETLEAHQRQRAELVASLRVELDSGSVELDRLKRNEEELSELVAGIGEELSGLALPADELESFVSLRGALPWPVSGSMLNRYGTPRPEGDLRWQGLLLEASEGSAVKAISHGRVAFADWLRGFGLLLIVDHGDGYMSLYGRNQSLFKEVGEWVKTGEQIAVVGASDASGPAALYFEIRHNGAPKNPTKWCRGSSLVSG